MTDRAPILERIIATVSPGWALQRYRRRMVLGMLGGYEGGKSRRRGLNRYRPGGGSADSDISPDLTMLRERSRDLVRNNPIAGGAIGTQVTNVVGSGLQLNARIDNEVLRLTDKQADEFQSRAERGFRHWCQRADYGREETFEDMQALVFRSVLESGDVFALLPNRKNPGDLFGLKLQIIEADRVCNPGRIADTQTLVSGVEITTEGTPTYYHIMTGHPGDLMSPQVWTPYPAWTKSGNRSVLHIFQKDRPGQHRGVPCLAPIIEKLKQLDRYTDAELMAAVVTGMLTVFIGSENKQGLDPMAPTDESGALPTDEDIKLGYGTIIEGGSNDKIETVAANRPNQAFDPFVLAIMRQIGMALGLPYEVLIKHFSASYSASRAAILEAWAFFRVRRAWLVRKFCRPVYEAWMTEAVASGYLTAPGFFSSPEVRAAYLGAEWIGSSPVQIDPVKEINAAKGRVELGITTRAEECTGMTGSDWWQKVPAMKQEREVMRELAPEEPAALPDDNPDQTQPDE